MDFDEYYRQLDNIQPAVPSPCNDCPWRRNSTRGWLGPNSIEVWLDIAHSDAPILCHKTIHGPDLPLDDPDLRQCKGAAIFRGNIGKSPRHPKVERASADVESVFAWDDEFEAHHRTESYERMQELHE